MPRLSSQSNHEELESNSTLQIKIKRKEGVEAENFAPQCENFALVRKFRTSAKLPFMCTVHVSIDFLTSVGHIFGFLPNFPHFNSIFSWFFLYFV